MSFLLLFGHAEFSFILLKADAIPLGFTCILSKILRNKGRSQFRGFFL